MNVSYGGKLPKISTSIPTKADLLFMGWYDNPNYEKGTQYYNSKNVSVKEYDKNSNIVLYAGWSERKKETTFSIPGKSFSSQYLVGRASDGVKYAKVGSVLNVLLSRWGFFVIIIVPFFVMFMIELFAIYTEIKYGKKNNN